ncbi:MAG: glycosyltransferase family 1 protein [Thermoprotei archaeon]
MRIGIYTHYIDKYPRNAPSLYQVELIRRLVEKTNLEIVLIHHKKSNLQIYKLAEEAIIPRFPYLREHEINRLDLDIIHFNAIPWSWWPTIAKINVPSIVTVHGTIHWDDPRLDDYTPPLVRVLKKTLEKKTSKHITHFIAISRHVRDVLINKLNIPSSKIDVVYLPIDHTVSKPLDSKEVQKVKAKYGIKSRYILHVSAFSKRKNPEVLLRSFHAVKKKVGDLILVIVGPGWNNAYVQKLITELGLQGHVRILGWVPREDLVALYNGAELLLFPSLHENFGFPLVEAMACGCPVVTSNVYAISEVVGDAALLCNPFDQECFVNNVLKILLDAQERENMVKKGYERARLFEWNSHINKIIEIYNRVRKYAR